MIALIVLSHLVCIMSFISKSKFADKEKYLLGNKRYFFCAGMEIFPLLGNKKGVERAAEEEKCLSGNKKGAEA